MVRVKDNNEIHLTRGDSVVFTVTLTQADGTAYQLGNNDVLIFSIRNEQAVVLSKEFTTTQITLTPQDTKKLACQPYRYEVELHSGDNVYTVVAWSMFFLENEVL